MLRRDMFSLVLVASSVATAGEGPARSLIWPDSELFGPPGSGWLSLTVTAGDLNGDNLPDLLQIPPGGDAVWMSGSVRRWLWGEPSMLATVDDRYPFRDAVIADVNGDGADDIAYWGGFAVTQLAGFGALLGDGAGGFAPMPLTVAGMTLREPCDQSFTFCRGDTIEIGDVTGDRIVDLVAAPERVYVLEGLGDGRFGSPIQVCGPSSGLELIDLSGDGVMEIVCGSQDEDSISVVTRKGSTWSTPSVFPIDDGFGVVDVSVIETVDLGGGPALLCSMHVSDTSALAVRVVEIGQNGELVLGPSADPRSATNFVVVADLVGGAEPELMLSGSVLFQDITPVSLGERTSAGPYRWTADTVDLDLDGDLDVLASGSAGFSAGEIAGSGATRSFVEAAVHRPLDLEVNSAGVEAADFNNDGRTDAALTFGPYTYILTRTPDGDFEAGLVTSSDGAARITTGDVDADGNADIALPGNPAMFFFGNGDGTFAEPVAVELPEFASETALADTDGDGLTDVVLSSSEGAMVLRQAAPRAFALVLAGELGESRLGIAVGDLNADGLDDFVAGTDAGVGPAVYLSNGDGSFGGPTLLGTGPSTESLVLEDFDADGDLDLAAAGDEAYGVYLYEGLGDGSFAFLGITDLTPSGSFETVQYLRAADADADGDPDLLAGVASPFGGSGQIHLLRGDGALGFEAHSLTPAGSSSFNHFDAADMNGDGTVDLLTASTSFDFDDGMFVYHGGIIIRENLITPQDLCPADLAAPAGVLDLQDLTAFIVAFTAGETEADLAAPFGVYDLSDLAGFVGVFNGGCP